MHLGGKVCQEEEERQYFPLTRRQDQERHRQVECFHLVDREEPARGKY